mmetsp:Transcript_49159/g.44015  ORF Transcript_49159/g.44015 Transcript_49159/m.44015 type:complete len:292 (+) Transcript_49159:29-904(+)
MSSVLLMLKLLCLILIVKIDGDTHNCNSDNQCNADNPVICASGESCTVNCDGDGACYHGKISCPAGQDCTVNCIGGNNGCRYADIDATHSRELWLTGCNYAGSLCYSMFIYCPPKVGDTKKCHMTGGGAPKNFDIYSINGFRDVDFSQYNGGCYGCGIGAFMFCEQDWKSQCQISESNWTCDATQPSGYSTICNNPPIPSIDSGSNGLSGGWIFIIIFFTGFLLYCLAGFVYKGQKNKEWKYWNIPNFNFWRALPAMVLVGCKVTYQWLSRSNNDDSLLKTTDQEVNYDDL